MDRKNTQDIAEKELIDLKQVATILGLKYHTARKVLLDENSLTLLVFGKRKRLWVKDEIFEFKRQHCIKTYIV